MNFPSIAMGRTQSKIFEENPTWHILLKTGGPIMGIQKKFWILVVIAKLL